MNILITLMFLLPLVLVTLYLYLSGVFTNRRAFQFGFHSLLVFFALTMGIVIQLSCQGYDLFLPRLRPADNNLVGAD